MGATEKILLLLLILVWGMYLLQAPNPIRTYLQKSLCEEKVTLDACKCSNDSANKILEKLGAMEKVHLQEISESKALVQEMRATILKELASIKSLIVTESSRRAENDEGIKKRLTSMLINIEVPLMEIRKTSPFCMNWKSNLTGLELTRIASGAYFYFSGSRQSFSQAIRWCKDRGMHLARFESKEEMKIVAENASNEEDDFWVGANDVGPEPGTFEWNDGSKLEREFFWNGGRLPMNDVQLDITELVEEACVFLSRDAGNYALWVEPCNSHNYFICEADTEYLSCL